MTRYRNNFYRSDEPANGPEYYETDVRPTEYKGFRIFRRQQDCFDCVTEMPDGPTCVRQMAGLAGAKRFIDDFWDRETAA